MNIDSIIKTMLRSVPIKIKKKTVSKKYIYICMSKV